MSSEVRLVVYRKATFAARFKIVDKKTRAGLDLTGKTLTLTVRETIDAAAAAFSISSGAGITHDPDQVSNAGWLDVAFTNVQTDLNLTEHVWDLWDGDSLLVPPSPMPVLNTVRQP